MAVSEQARPALLAPWCLLLAICLPTCFIVSRPNPRLPPTQNDFEPRRLPDGIEGFGTCSTLAMAAMTAFAAKTLRARVIRHAQRRQKQKPQRIVGFRDIKERMSNNWDEEIRTRERVRNYYYGQRGYKKNLIDPRLRDREPARMNLGHVTEAMSIFKTQDFYKADFAKLSADSVTEVGSYQVTGAGKISIPATVPTYSPIKRGTRLEKEPGFKRPSVEDEAYVKYVDEKCTLYETAKEAAPSSLEKDIICDRGSLLTLLDFVSETLTPFLTKKGQHSSAVDLVKISKSPSGKGLVLEKILDVEKMTAEIPYRGGWKREEVSNHGTFKPALQRAMEGDSRTRTISCTGLLQVAGSTAGELDQCFRFLEFELGGLSFLTKARAHAQKDGEYLDVAHKNWYYQDEVKALTTYLKMLFGKIDKSVLVLQRSGKVHEAVEKTVEDIAEKQPLIVEAAERRLGRLVKLLKEVQKAVDSDSGPWVLQWQRGQLILGKFELVEVAQEMATA